jgi:hypothetical protein
MLHTLFVSPAGADGQPDSKVLTIGAVKQP